MDSTSCTDATAVCEITVGTTGTCVIKADGVATGCTPPRTYCPTNAVCQTNVCVCNNGYTNDTNGLCTAVIGMVCSNDTGCSTALTNTRCEINQLCTMGRCQCDTGYTGGAGQICTQTPVIKEFGQACVVTDTCASTLTCTGGICQCSTAGHIYRSEIKICTDKALLREPCTTISDCFITAVGHGACTGGGNGGGSSGVCACATGYMEENYGCRQPTRDESCHVSTPCMVSADTSNILTGESSSVDPTCLGGTCSCRPGTSSPFEREFMGVCYKLCLNDLPSTTTPKENGMSCTSFNECSSKACFQCPEDDSPKCKSAECSSQFRNSAVGITTTGLGMAGLLLTAKLLI